MPNELQTLSTSQTFDLPASRLADAVKRVEKFGRKAAKLGMSAPSLTATHRWARTWLVDGAGRPLHDDSYDAHLPWRSDVRRSSVEMVRVVVEGERPVISGWSFVAALRHTVAGNVIDKAPGTDVELPREYRECGPEYCDHCGYRRQRNDTFVLRHVDTGEWIRVGRNCLADFLATPDSASWMAVFLWEKTLREWSESDEIGDGMGYDSAAPVVPVETFLAACFAVTRVDGYVSASAAYVGNPCTADVVLRAMSSTKIEEWRSVADLITERDDSKAKAALAWLASDAAGDSDYIHTLRVFVGLGTVDHSGSRRIASLVPSYDKELVRKGPEKVNEHLPYAVGERPVLEAMLERTGGYNTDYGYTWVLTFRTVGGRALVWKTSSPYDVTGEDLEIGADYRIVGKVTEHGEYRGEKQTRFTRCKLARLDQWADIDAKKEEVARLEAQGARTSTVGRHRLFLAMMSLADCEASLKPFVSAARKHAKAHDEKPPRWAWTARELKKESK